jgi:hypothetical protein
MTKLRTRTDRLTGNLTCANPTRSAFGHRRRPAQGTGDRVSALTAPAALAASTESEPPNGGPSVSAGAPQPLRRWSVAQLIARAAVAPPADGVARR